MKKTHLVMLDRDGYLLLLKLVVAWGGLENDSIGFNEAIVKTMNEVNRATPSDAVIHTDSIPDAFIVEKFKGLL